MEISRAVVIKSFLWKLFERLGTQIIGFVISIVLARLLLPEQYGEVALIMIFINVCNVIIDGGLNTALIQKKNANNIDFSTIFFFSLLISIFLYAILYFLSPYVANFYNNPNLAKFLRVLGLNLIFYAINSIQRAYVSKYMLFSKLFYSSFIAGIISGLLGIYMAYNGYGVWALVAQSLSSIVISTLVMWYTINWRPMLVFSVPSFIQLFNYGWKILIANFITIVFIEVRKLFIGKIYSPSDLAYYEKGEQFPNLIMNNIFTSIQTILLPTFSEFQDDKLRVKTMMRRSTKMSCFLIYPMMAGMIVVAEPLVICLLGTKWIATVPYLQIMCIANFFRPITISNWEAIKALGHSEIILKLEIVKKVLDIIILLVSIQIGVTAVAWGVVLLNFICVFINLAPNVKLLNYSMKEQLLDAFPTLLYSLLMGGIIYSLKFIVHNSLTLLTLQILIGIVAYMIICKIAREESFNYLINMIKKK